MILFSIFCSMSMEKTTKALFIIIAGLMSVFFVRDWYVFFQCGAVESCLVESSFIQHFTKFSVTVLIAAAALFLNKNCIGKRDHRFLQVGMLATLCADFFFKILHNVPNAIQENVDCTLIGICFFFVFQILLICRHTRTSDEDKHFPKILVYPLAASLVFVALWLMGVYESVLVLTVASYGAFLICSLVVACRIHGNSFYPKRNASLIRRGLIMFFCGDVCVGLSLMTGPNYSTQEFLATVANNFVWFFYVPSLLCIVFSAYKR